MILKILRGVYTVVSFWFGSVWSARECANARLLHIFIVVIDIQEKPHLEIFMLFTWTPPAVLEHFLRLRTLKQTSLLTSWMPLDSWVPGGAHTLQFKLSKRVYEKPSLFSVCRVHRSKARWATSCWQRWTLFSFKNIGTDTGFLFFPLMNAIFVCFTQPSPRRLVTRWSATGFLSPWQVQKCHAGGKLDLASH